MRGATKNGGKEEMMRWGRERREMGKLRGMERAKEGQKKEVKEKDREENMGGGVKRRKGEKQKSVLY